MATKTVSMALNTKDVERAIARLRERAKPSIARALNRATVSARTVMVKKIGPDIGLAAAQVKDAIVTREATPERLSAHLAASLKRIPLVQFKAKGPESVAGGGATRRRGGVTYKIGTGGKGRAPNAFIVTMRSGHRGVFQRSSAPRLPLAELKGPSIGHVFDKYVGEGLDRGLEALATNLRSELKFALSTT